MNAHVTIPADRSLLPRSLLPRRPVPATPATIASGEWQPPATIPWVRVKRYKFALGTRVCFHGQKAVVIGQMGTSDGEQMFYIDLIEGDDCGRPHRLVRAEYLTRYKEFPSLPRQDSGGA